MLYLEGQHKCGCGYCEHGHCDAPNGGCHCYEDVGGPSCSVDLKDEVVCNIEEASHCFNGGTCKYASHPY